MADEKDKLDDPADPVLPGQGHSPEAMKSLQEGYDFMEPEVREEHAAPPTFQTAAPVAPREKVHSLGIDRTTGTTRAERQLNVTSQRRAERGLPPLGDPSLPQQSVPNEAPVPNPAAMSGAGAFGGDQSKVVSLLESIEKLLQEIRDKKGGFV